MTVTAQPLAGIWGHPATTPHRFIRMGAPTRRKAAESESCRWDMRSTEPAPSFAIIEARKSLEALALPRATQRAVDAFLGSVCTAQSTVPSVTRGEEPDSAFLHWVSGPMSIEVEVGPNGATYFWGADEHGTKVSLEDSRTQIEAAVRSLVTAMAQRVRRSNPGWREQYLQR